jgi:hypothetical protein
MTWKLTHHRSPGSSIAAEYECPVHGRFAVDVPRDENGDPPASRPCPRAWDWGIPCVAGAESPFVISAPGIARVRKVEVHRGSYQKAEVPTWTDTTNLGEGQDIDDWKADRAKVWERENERQAMELAREL